MLLVVAPTKRELVGLLLAHPQQVTVAVTGLGQGPATASMQALLQTSLPEGVISLGFAGGVDSDLRSGDLVLCTQTLAQEPGNGAWTSCKGDRRLLEQASEALADLPHREGALLTVAAPLLSPREKTQAFQVTAAAVVDMEGHWMAVACGQAGVPFLALRAVVDSAQETLPSLIKEIVAANSRRETLTTAMYLLRRPWSLVSLIRLARHAEQAVRSLRQGVRQVLPSLLEARAGTELR